MLCHKKMLSHIPRKVNKLSHLSTFHHTHLKPASPAKEFVPQRPMVALRFLKAKLPFGAQSGIIAVLSVRKGGRFAW